MVFENGKLAALARTSHRSKGCGNYWAVRIPGVESRYQKSPLYDFDHTVCLSCRRQASLQGKFGSYVSLGKQAAATATVSRSPT